LSRRFRKGIQKQSKNYLKQKQRLGKLHLKVQRQRKDWAIKLARCVVASNDVVVYEDLQVQNLVKNHTSGQVVRVSGAEHFPGCRMEHFHRVAGRLRQGVRTTSRLRDWQGGDCRAAGVHHPGVFKVRLPGEEDFIHSHTPMPALRSGAVSRPQRRSQHLAPRSRTLGQGVERYLRA
jgi:hypothetical protein